MQLLLSKVNRDHLQFGAFFFALFVYAFWGAPTPDAPSLPEILIGFALVIAIGVGRIGHSFIISFKEPRPLWFMAGQILLVYGAVMPLCMAGFEGAGFSQIIRDLAGFFFFLLPVFMVGLFERRPDYIPYFLWGVVGVGLVFALRSVLHTYPFNLLSSRFFDLSNELFYFANAASVFFAGLILCGRAGERLVRDVSVRGTLFSLFLLFLASLPLFAMALSVQRATLGSFILYIVILLALAVWRYPVKAVRPTLLLVVLVALTLPALKDVGFVLGQKNALVGLNMRMDELAAVWSVISSNASSLLFGIGWGGGFHSPAVGGLTVYFTHNLLSYMLLKTGLVGLLISLVYLGGLGQRLVLLIFKNPVFGLAVAAPVLVNIFLYASFKSLDFGLVFLLIPALLLYFGQRKTL